MKIAVTRDTSGMNWARIFSQISKIASTVIWTDFWRYFSSAVSPYILANLKDCEHCNLDRLLAVFLERCRTIDSFTPGATNGHNCLDLNSNYVSVSRKLFDLCLEKVIPLSNDARPQESIQEYQQACKEARHIYFVKLANWALGLSKSVELPGLRGESTSQIIFHLNDQRTTDQEDSKRLPDIVVPLSATKRVCTEPNEDGKGSRNQLEWADVLVSTEIKCHLSTLDLHPLGTCNTVLQCPIDPLPTCIEDPDMASTLSVSPTGTTRTENSAGTPDHQKRCAEHPEQTN
ncbi:hypothetical protein RSAG8_07663, partial [Rhizoctonia solani AG-8 WAC10335]